MKPDSAQTGKRNDVLDICVIMTCDEMLCTAQSILVCHLGVRSIRHSPSANGAAAAHSVHRQEIDNRLILLT